MPFNRPVIIVILLIVLALFSLQRCRGEEGGEVRRSRIIMGTVVEITALGPDPARLDAAVSAAFDEMARIETLMSPHVVGSDIARLAPPVSEAVVAPETAAVIALGLQVAEASGGAFDMALGGLKALWAIETDQPRVPEAEQLRTALADTGPGALRLDGTRVVKAAPGLAVDLGGIAKGYAIDRAVAILAEAGIARASVNAGGDLRLLGDRGDRPWRVGIQHPRKSGAVLATLEMADTAIVTSGDYERYFEQGATRYHHLFDPATGYPARLSQSVTLVAANAALADALATAVFVLGPERGLALLEQFPGAEGVVIDAQGTAHVSAGLKERVQWR